MLNKITQVDKITFILMILVKKVQQLTIIIVLKHLQLILTKANHSKDRMS
jgi:hypothetical protein